MVDRRIRASSRRSADRRRRGGSCRSGASTCPPRPNTSARLAMRPSAAFSASEPMWRTMPSSAASAEKRATDGSPASGWRLAASAARLRWTMLVISGVCTYWAPRAGGLAHQALDRLDVLRDVGRRAELDAGGGESHRRPHAASSRVEFAARTQCVEIVAPADMVRPDENLREREAAGAVDHFLPLIGGAGRVDLLERDAQIRQQPLGGGAISTELAGIDRHARHPRLVENPCCGSDIWCSQLLYKLSVSNCHAGESEHIDRAGAGAQQRPRRRLGGGAGGVDIVDEQNRLRRQCGRASNRGRGRRRAHCPRAAPRSGPPGGASAFTRSSTKGSCATPDSRDRTSASIAAWLKRRCQRRHR